MSLAVAALRLSAVKSLDGATSAGDRVFDSVVDPRELVGENAAPAIVIYTDAGRRRVDQRDLACSDCHIDLTVELFAAKATKITIPADESGTGQPEEGFEVEYPASDAGLENRLRRLAYEIESIFQQGTGPWAEMWRRSVISFAPDREVEWARGADNSRGGRFNFLRIVYPIKPVGDPLRGVPLPGDGYWKAWFDLADADDELKDLSRDWRALVTTPTLADYQREAARMGLTKTEADNIGLTPLADPADGDDLPALNEITVDPIGTVLVAGPMTEITQDSGEGNAPNP